MRKIHNRKGFTLIELMIVVAIIGIIAAIAVPTLISTRAAAQRSNAQGVLSTVRSAEAAYYAQYGQYADFTTLQSGAFLDNRFTGNTVTIKGVVFDFVGSSGLQTFSATATLPNSAGVMTVDQTGQIYGGGA